jgi:hypothetical protein
MSARAKDPLAPGRALLALAEEVSDAADKLACAVETVKELISLALQELESDTTTRASSAVLGARRFIFDLDDLVSHLNSLSSDAKGVQA